jgi:DNA-binding helix-hairpin-helix protein with protein kinase domain
VTDKAGVLIPLGAIISQSGSDAVYQVPGDSRLAAKVYHGGTSRHLTSKLNSLVQVESQELHRVASWPISLLYPKGSDDPIGFRMPLPSSRNGLHTLYSPKARSLHFKTADWKFLIRAAINTASAFNAVHKAGCVLGDIHPASILVGQDASIRLADCDAFQIGFDSSVSAGGNALDTLTPPELQGKPFGALVRGVNHDNFGLAVLIFQLLFMGRHPFAGRYAGGDMPIPRAIAEFRFAYGTRRAAHMMEQPPGTPALSIVGPEVAALFERAFGKSAVKGGRPTPREWMSALTRLEHEVIPCAADASHWHQIGSACPWCRIEAGAGSASRFLADDPSRAVGRLGPGFEAMWKEVKSLEAPSEAPGIAFIDSSPSETALAIRRKENYGHVAAFGIAATLIGIGVLSKIEAVHPLWFIAAGIAAFFIMHAFFNTASDEAALKRRLERARTRWEAAEAEWGLRTGSEEFSRQRSHLETLRQAWDQLPALARRKHEELKQNHWALQRRRYLDGYLIGDAKIQGLTEELRAFLASYGIETAADIDITRFNAVPGMPGQTLDSLMAWRTSIERDFLFNPNLPTDPADLARVERELLAERHQLEGQLQNGLATLKQIRSDIEAARRSLKEPTERAYRNFAQAQIDAAVLS